MQMITLSQQRQHPPMELKDRASKECKCMIRFLCLVKTLKLDNTYSNDDDEFNSTDSRTKILDTIQRHQQVSGHHTRELSLHLNPSSSVNCVLLQSMLL